MPIIPTVPYREFLESKIQLAPPTEIDDYFGKIDPILKPHQRDIVNWMLKQGRGLIAASFGLGKTFMQIQVAKILHEQTGNPFLVVAPFGVKPYFQTEDGPRLGVHFEYVRTDAEIREAQERTPYLITNYERVRDGDIDPRKHTLAGASLDEGSVLRSLGSKTYHVFEQVFSTTENRYVCTATPSPNNYKEIIYYAQFLGIMDAGQALTRWFMRNPDKAGDLRIHPQHERSFWMWVASWALFVYKPSDLGHSDEGYDLPPLTVNWHPIPVDHTRAWDQIDNRGQRRLVLDVASGVKEAAREKRETVGARLAKSLEIIAQNPDDHFLLWHHQEREREAIEDAIPGAVTVYGSQKLELREQHILDFSHGKIKILATKPEIAGSGCNFQRHCHHNIFMGIDYRFQDFIQAIHRTRRYLQEHEVIVDIIYAESESPIADALKLKWRQHDELVAKMQQIVRKYGLSHAAMRRDLARQIGVDREEVRGELFTAVCNDCVLELQSMADASVDLVVTSIPFGNHYEYTTNLEDFGHNPSDGDFWGQMDYLLPELYRVVRPGRNLIIHVKDRVLYSHQTESGLMEIAPFSDETVAAFRKHGFLFEGRITVVTDVVRENNSSYRLGYTEMCNDSTKMGCGLPEYVLIFRTPTKTSTTSRADEPVTKKKSEYPLAAWQLDAAPFWQSSGNVLVHTPPYDYDSHVARLNDLAEKGHLPTAYCAEPAKSHSEWVWDDVVFMQTLNSDQSRKDKINHICPLPFDIVERAIRLRSNPGELVLDPFSGLFTVPYMAVKMGRRAYGVELNPYYFECGVRYCWNMEGKKTAPTLFDLAEYEVA